MSRAVDETGYVQPTRKTLIASRGISSVGYHTNPITGWQIRSGRHRGLSRGAVDMKMHLSPRRRVRAAVIASAAAARAQPQACARRRPTSASQGAGDLRHRTAGDTRGDRRARHRRRSRRRRPAAGTRHAGRWRADLRGALCQLPRQDRQGRAERRARRAAARRRVSVREAIRERPRPSAATGRTRRRCSTTSAARCRPTSRAR